MSRARADACTLRLRRMPHYPENLGYWKLDGMVNERPWTKFRDLGSSRSTIPFSAWHAATILDPMSRGDIAIEMYGKLQRLLARWVQVQSTRWSCVLAPEYSQQMVAWDCPRGWW